MLLDCLKQLYKFQRYNNYHHESPQSVFKNPLIKPSVIPFLISLHWDILPLITIWLRRWFDPIGDILHRVIPVPSRRLTHTFSASWNPMSVPCYFNSKKVSRSPKSFISDSLVILCFSCWIPSTPSPGIYYHLHRQWRSFFFSHSFRSRGYLHLKPLKPCCQTNYTDHVLGDFINAL